MTADTIIETSEEQNLPNQNTKESKQEPVTMLDEPKPIPSYNVLGSIWALEPVGSVWPLHDPETDCPEPGTFIVVNAAPKSAMGASEGQEPECQHPECQQPDIDNGGPTQEEVVKDSVHQTVEMIREAESVSMPGLAVEEPAKTMITEPVPPPKELTGCQGQRVLKMMFLSIPRFFKGQSKETLADKELEGIVNCSCTFDNQNRFLPKGLNSEQENLF